MLFLRVASLLKRDLWRGPTFDKVKACSLASGLIRQYIHETLSRLFSSTVWLWRELYCAWRRTFRNRSLKSRKGRSSNCCKLSTCLFPSVVPAVRNASVTSSRSRDRVSSLSLEILLLIWRHTRCFRFFDERMIFSEVLIWSVFLVKFCWTLCVAVCWKDSCAYISSTWISKSGHFRRC